MSHTQSTNICGADMHAQGKKGIGLEESSFCWRWWLKKYELWLLLLHFTIFFGYISRLFSDVYMRALMNSVLLAVSISQQLKWHHLKQFMSFHIAPSRTTKACTQLLFHTCSDTPKACKQTLMFKPCWIYKPLNSSNICSRILIPQPTCSAACT